MEVIPILKTKSKEDRFIQLTEKALITNTFSDLLASLAYLNLETRNISDKRQSYRYSNSEQL